MEDWEERLMNARTENTNSSIILEKCWKIEKQKQKLPAI